MSQTPHSSVLPVQKPSEYSKEVATVGEFGWLALLAKSGHESGVNSPAAVSFAVLSQKLLPSKNIFVAFHHRLSDVDKCSGYRLVFENEKAIWRTYL